LAHGQSDFLQKSQQKICHQLQTDDVRLLAVADSLYGFLDEHQDPKTKAYLHFWKALGHFHSSEQPLDSVVRYATKAHEQFLQLNDNEGLFEAHSLLGRVLPYVNDFKGAQKHLNQAKERANTGFKRFRNLVDYGHKYVFEDNIDSAFVMLYAAEKILPSINENSCWYSLYNTELNINLGTAEMWRVGTKPDYNKSIKYFKRAINAYGLSPKKSVENYLFCLNGLYFSYRRAGFVGVKSIHLDSARVYLEEYIHLTEKLPVGNKYSKLEDAYANLGWQLHAEGKSNEGIYHVQRSRNYLDSMYMDLMDQRVLEITNSYENKLKDQEIETLNQSNSKTRRNLLLVGLVLVLSVILLVVLILTYKRSKQQNVLLRQQQQELTQVKNSLEVLLQEIHHRIKNNLQVISSFLGIQKRELKQQEAIAALEQSQARIQTIAVLHEQLYNQKGLENVDVQSYFETLIAHIQHNISGSKKVAFKLAVQPCVLNFEDCLSLGIIVNELVTNALKYAFENDNKNEISITFSKENTHYLLEVSDNGKGMPKNVIPKGTGMGYQIIHAMVEKLNGRLKMISKKGVKVELRFPK
jgi:two-component sensor histidine kinase/tetratricopeptide (TPR) repeat protein